MPVDSDGNRADLVMGGEATISRMNLGRLYEHYLYSAIRDVGKLVRRILGVEKNCTPDILRSISSETIHHAYQQLLDFFKLVTNDQYEFFKALSEDEIYEYLSDVVNNGFFIYYPISNQKDGVQMVKAVEERFHPTYGPVSYVGNSGERVTTENNIRIAPLYMMLLDKIADDWSSVSSARLQHFGVLSPVTRAEKFSQPFRSSPVRTIGETEGRIFVGYCGVEAMAEMMDRSNNPLTQRNIVWNILNAGQPSNMHHVVDRNLIPLGNSRPLSLLNHIFQCAGFTAVYEPEDQ